MFRANKIYILIFLTLSSINVHAQDGVSPVPATVKQVEDLTEKVEQVESDVSDVKNELKGIQERTKFGGIDWGVGVSITGDLGSNHRIKEASIVDGIVRIDDQQNMVARLMLESHYFFTPKPKSGEKKCFKAFIFFGEVACNYSREGGAGVNWGWGPFVAIQPGNDEIIDAVALGVMIGFKRNDDQNDSSSWNLGVGVVVDPDGQILGDGFIRNQAPPGNETVIRYKEKEQAGWMILFSATF